MSHTKIGRNAKRSPAMARYRNENRTERNKRLNIDREAKLQGRTPDQMRKIYDQKVIYG